MVASITETDADIVYMRFGEKTNEDRAFAESLATSAGLICRFRFVNMDACGPPEVAIRRQLREMLLPLASGEQETQILKELRRSAVYSGRRPVAGLNCFNQVEYFGPLAGSPDAATINSILAPSQEKDWHEIAYWKEPNFSLLRDTCADRFGTIRNPRTRLALFTDEVEALAAGKTVRYHFKAFPGFIVNEFDGYAVQDNRFYWVKASFID